jgi:hypothetical protein
MQTKITPSPNEKHEDQSHHYIFYYNNVCGYAFSGFFLQNSIVGFLLEVSWKFLFLHRILVAQVFPLIEFMSHHFDVGYVPGYTRFSTGP